MRVNQLEQKASDRYLHINYYEKNTKVIIINNQRKKNDFMY